jgi:hypothetical protein
MHKTKPTLLFQVISETGILGSALRSRLEEPLKIYPASDLVNSPRTDDRKWWSHKIDLPNVSGHLFCC